MPAPLRTPEKDAAFFAALAESGNVSKSAIAIGASRSIVYEWREADPEFAARWERAMKVSVLGMEDEAKRRAIEGVAEEIFDKDGNPSGTKTKYSDTLLIFLMKAHDPKYRENSKLELSGPDGGAIELNDTSRAAKLATKVAQLQERAERAKAVLEAEDFDLA